MICELHLNEAVKEASLVAQVVKNLSPARETWV